MTTYRNLADIARDVRTELRREFPGYKFSVTIHRYSGGQSMTVALMAGPIRPFVDPSVTYAQLYGPRIEKIDGVYSSNGTRLTDEAARVLIRANEIANRDNWDRSDYQADYHDVNYYFHLNVGKWNVPYIFTGAAPEHSPDDTTQDKMMAHYSGIEDARELAEGAQLPQDPERDALVEQMISIAHGEADQDAAFNDAAFACATEQESDGTEAEARAMQDAALKELAHVIASALNSEQFEKARRELWLTTPFFTDDDDEVSKEVLRVFPNRKAVLTWLEETNFGKDSTPEEGTKMAGMLMVASRVMAEMASGFRSNEVAETAIALCMVRFYQEGFSAGAARAQKK